MIWIIAKDAPDGEYLGLWPHRDKAGKVYHPIEGTRKVKGKWITWRGRAPTHVLPAIYAKHVGTHWFPPMPPLPADFWTEAYVHKDVR